MLKENLLSFERPTLGLLKVMGGVGGPGPRRQQVPLEY